jgi:DNA-directed RNA polymerase subunit H (RpoH/RPB5)
MATEKKHFNIMNHKLVPLHMIISEKEREELLKKYNIEPSGLPKILDTDPVSIYIGAKPGQILKIIRKSHTAKEAVSYRLVVESNK